MRLTTVLSVTTPILLLLLTLPSTLGDDQPPHIVIYMIDDLGWGDVAYHDPEMSTTNIDNMAKEGVQLKYSYMMQSCTPSRASFLTGYYAYRYGLQQRVLRATENGTLPLHLRVFPQDLQDNGYCTHFVGKWHLGFCRREMTPTYRGFDTFYGKYNGLGDHYTHISKRNGYDLQDNKGLHDFKADLSGNGTYSTELFTSKAVEIINNHNVSKPLFLFLSYQAVHGPFQVPQHYIDKYCPDVTVDNKRRKHCGMTAAVDEGIGNVTQALKDKGIYENLITLFISDNGGPIKKGSSNWPLRGSKKVEWEGGTRVVSILNSEKYLPSSPYTWNGVIHAVDWYPTLLRAANISVNTDAMDGMDLWDNIVNNEESSRTEFVYNLNDVKGNYALRWNQYKLVQFNKSNPDGWKYPPDGVAEPKKPKKNIDYRLFDINDDPGEHTDLLDPEVITSEYNETKLKMIQKLDDYKTGLVATPKPTKVKKGKPRKNDGLWVTGWC